MATEEIGLRARKNEGLGQSSEGTIKLRDEAVRAQHARAGEGEMKRGMQACFSAQSETRLPAGCRAVRGVATRTIVDPHRLRSLRPI